MTVRCSDQAASASRRQQQSDLPRADVRWQPDGSDDSPTYDMIIQ